MRPFLLPLFIFVCFTTMAVPLIAECGRWLAEPHYTGAIYARNQMIRRHTTLSMSPRRVRHANWRRASRS